MRKTEFSKTIEVPVYTIKCTHKDGTITFFDDWCSFPNYDPDNKNPVRDPNFSIGFVLPNNVDDCYFGCEYPNGYWNDKSIIKQEVIEKRLFEMPESIVDRFDAYCFEQCG